MYQKKSKLKGWIILFVIFVIVILGLVGYRVYQGKKQAQEAAKQEMVLEENQYFTYVAIQKMLGNEMIGAMIENGQQAQEQCTWLIPVGTDVETKLGTITTFARLAAGDQIKMLMETTGNGTDEIIKIWIEQ